MRKKDGARRTHREGLRSSLLFPGFVLNLTQRQRWQRHCPMSHTSGTLRSTGTRAQAQDMTMLTERLAS